MKIASAFATLERLIAESRRHWELRRLKVKTAAYYRRLTHLDELEETEWAKFSDSEFSKISEGT